MHIRAATVPLKTVKAQQRMRERHHEVVPVVVGGGREVGREVGTEAHQLLPPFLSYLHWSAILFCSVHDCFCFTVAHTLAGPPPNRHLPALSLFPSLSNQPTINYFYLW